MNGDGSADLVFGSAEWSSTRVLILSGKALVQTGTQVVLADFAPVGTAYGFGIRVAVRDLDGDGKADLLIGAGRKRGNLVTAYLGKNLAATGTPPAAFAFEAYPGFKGGVFMG